MGKHFLLNLFEVDSLLLTEMDAFINFINPTLTDCLATILDESKHKFPEPGGYTYMALLSTSHFSIHTRPEHKSAALDLFTCGDIKSEEIIHYIIKYFQPVNFDLKAITR